MESASTVTVYDGRSGFIVSETVDYPLKALVFTSNNQKALVNLVSEISFSLRGNTAAYSLLISNNGTKVFLFPQVKLLTLLFYLEMDYVSAIQEWNNTNT